MINVINNFRREIDSVLSATLAEGPANRPISPQLIPRLFDVVGTWVSILQPQCAAAGVPREVTDLLSREIQTLAKMASAGANRKLISLQVGHVRRILVRQLLLEIAKIPYAIQLNAQSQSPASLVPEIPDLPSHLVPNSLQGWVPQMRKFLAQSSFDRNVFVMVAYRKALASLIKRVKEALIQLNVNPVIARDNNLTDDLYNPVACLLCCNYGVAIFDRPEVKQTHNPNVVYELGMMQLLKRRCVILKHRKLKSMPSDLLHRLYEDYSDNDEAIRKLNAWWARSAGQ